MTRPRACGVPCRRPRPWRRRPAPPGGPRAAVFAARAGGPCSRALGCAARDAGRDARPRRTGRGGRDQPRGARPVAGAFAESWRLWAGTAASAVRRPPAGSGVGAPASSISRGALSGFSWPSGGGTWTRDRRHDALAHPCRHRAGALRQALGYRRPGAPAARRRRPRPFTAYTISRPIRAVAAQARAVAAGAGSFMAGCVAARCAKRTSSGPRSTAWRRRWSAGPTPSAASPRKSATSSRRRSPRCAGRSNSWATTATR